MNHEKRHAHRVGSPQHAMHTPSSAPESGAGPPLSSEPGEGGQAGGAGGDAGWQELVPLAGVETRTGAGMPAGPPDLCTEDFSFRTHQLRRQSPSLLS